MFSTEASPVPNCRLERWPAGVGIVSLNQTTNSLQGASRECERPIRLRRVRWVEHGGSDVRYSMPLIAEVRVPERSEHLCYRNPRFELSAGSTVRFRQRIKFHHFCFSLPCNLGVFEALRIRDDTFRHSHAASSTEPIKRSERGRTGIGTLVGMSVCVTPPIRPNSNEGIPPVESHTTGRRRYSS